tara:strand:+ start:95 stop:472 length:378 start_codon:yes stop_codon:yes gene_type:complete
MKIGNLVKVLNVDLPAARGRTEGFANQIGVIMDLAGDITQDFSDDWDVQVCLTSGETRWLRAEILTELSQKQCVELVERELSRHRPAFSRSRAASILWRAERATQRRDTAASLSRTESQTDIICP